MLSIGAITSQAPSPDATTSQSPSSAKSKTPTAPVDTVKLSPAAQAAKAELQELTETPAQTRAEAARGDQQAQRLLEREAAERAL